MKSSLLLASTRNARDEISLISFSFCDLIDGDAFSATSRRIRCDFFREKDEEKQEIR